VSSNLYLKVIQELLEMGDAIRVSKERLARGNDDESDSEDQDEDDDCNDYYTFTDRLRQRKMSLTGVLEQSAALLDLKLEDEIELEASYLKNVKMQERRKQVSDLAPPYLSSNRGNEDQCQ
jgi:hypothetical protein